MAISQKDGGFTNTGFDIFEVKIGDIVPANVMQIKWTQDGPNTWSGRVTVDRDCADLESLTNEKLVVIITERRSDRGYTKMIFENPEWRLSETWKGAEPTQATLRFFNAKRYILHLDQRPERVSA